MEPTKAEDEVQPFLPEEERVGDGEGSAVVMTDVHYGAEMEEVRGTGGFILPHLMRKVHSIPDLPSQYPLLGFPSTLCALDVGLTSRFFFWCSGKLFRITDDQDVSS